MLSRTILTPTSDEDLACRAQEGCAASFEQLLRRFQAPVLQFLRRRGLGADAEDVTQETFLRVHEHLHRYSRRWAFSAWLFAIARRTGINYRRRIRPVADAAAAEAAVSPGVRPLDALVDREERRRLWDLAARVLSEEQVSALWLFYVEDMPVRGIALVLRRSRASIKVMLFAPARSCCRWSPTATRTNASHPSRRETCGSRKPRIWRSAMSETVSRPEDKMSLGERLRREALDSRPAFSEALHRRILSEIARNSAENDGPSVLLLDRPLAEARRRRKRSVMALAAAACFVCAVAVGWRLGELREESRRLAVDAESPMADLAMLDALRDRAATEISGLIVSVELTPSPARWSSEARQTAEAILDPLPIDVGLASSAQEGGAIPE